MGRKQTWSNHRLTVNGDQAHNNIFSSLPLVRPDCVFSFVFTNILPQSEKKNNNNQNVRAVGNDWNIFGDNSIPSYLLRMGSSASASKNNDDVVSAVTGSLSAK